LGIEENLRQLAVRLDRLEAIEAIKDLKSRYLNACDRQDPEAVRDCFAEGEVIIDMAYFGYCHNRNEFVDEIFVPRGCHDYVLDMHQCSNPEIELIDSETAKGTWSLNYRNINTQNRTLTLLSALYHDEYRKMGGAWKISRSKTEYRTVLHCTYESGSLQTLVAGRSLEP
jgi:hypothetical protein